MDELCDDFGGKLTINEITTSHVTCTVETNVNDVYAAVMDDKSSREDMIAAVHTLYALSRLSLPDDEEDNVYRYLGQKLDLLQRLLELMVSLTTEWPMNHSALTKLCTIFTNMSASKQYTVYGFCLNPQALSAFNMIWEVLLYAPQSTSSATKTRSLQNIMTLTIMFSNLSIEDTKMVLVACPTLITHQREILAMTLETADLSYDVRCGSAWLFRRLVKSSGCDSAETLLFVHELVIESGLPTLLHLLHTYAHETRVLYHTMETLVTLVEHQPRNPAWTMDRFDMLAIVVVSVFQNTMCSRPAPLLQNIVGYTKVYHKMIACLSGVIRGVSTNTSLFLRMTLATCADSLCTSGVSYDDHVAPLQGLLHASFE